MVRPIPQLLFRAWSSDSNGVNSQTVFKSGHQSDGIAIQDSDRNGLIPDLGEKLRNALLWKHIDDNPFIFFSSSLLFVLQLAGRMKARGETNIYITCLNTASATTSDGSTAIIHSVNDLLKTHEIEIRNRSDNSLRQYASEYVGLKSVCPAAGSAYVRYEAVIASGLFDLYPQMHDINQRRNVRLHLAATDLRHFGFIGTSSLIKAEIDVAAKLVFSFIGCASNFKRSEEFECHLLAWFLSFKMRSDSDDVLTRWINLHTSIDLDGGGSSAPDIRAMDLDEVEVIQYKQLLKLFAGRSLLGNRVDSSSTIDSTVIAHERAAWHSWRQASRDQHRAERAKRNASDYVYAPRRRNNRLRTLGRHSSPRGVSNQQRGRSRSPGRQERRWSRDYRRRDRE